MNTRELLSDEESRALRAGDGAGDPQGPAPEGRVVDVHADHWERIAPDRMPALESVSERLASLLKVTARRFFRQSAEVTARAWRVERWGLYARRLPVPISLNVLDIRPAGLKGALTLDTGFVFSLVDIFFGGDGKAERGAALAEFTPMETRLVRKFVAAVLVDLKEAWKPFGPLDAALGNTEVNPLFAAVASNSDNVWITGFDLTVNGHDFRFEVVLPHAVVEPLQNLQDAAGRAAADGSARRWESRLSADVQDARVALRGVIACSEISLRDLTRARPGDIIPTDLVPTVTLYAGDTPLLEGTFGIFQGRNAVRITKPANRITVGEKYGRGENP
ncbi:MAG: FliM/FliN family flagellar motor switch protein [Gammaproteobacteria bacterium]|nr:FliM/FliN family flagellar motor switch protein [Gammaproteobacteria bacterium]